ncbi:CocE/NonD family hydrolase [Rhodobacteraceae bacterium NNCM2]|nr:CocE/NonD family hydrolase [Coraliihabitans acroporae]
MKVEIIQNVWIPLPDGRRLAAKLWLPMVEGPVPAILEYLPYRKRDGTAPRDATTHPVFAENGYACIRVDIAGTGDSDGLFDDEYSEQELSDGEAVLAWIADQPWCDGNIGMIGISWGGFNGLQLAFRQPDPLKAIVTVCSTTDRYEDDIHYMGGCLLTDNFNWGCQMLAYQTRPADPVLRNDWQERWLKRIEKLPFMAADWFRHPARDDFWKHGSVCEDWSAIKAAVLSIGGWADAYLNAPSALAANLDAPVKALVGPWEHKFPHIARINPADFHGEVLRWFDHWLKGVENGADDLPAYRHFQQEHDNPSRLYGPAKGVWKAEREWPSPDVSETTLSLTAEGLSTAPGTGTMTVASDLRVGQTAAYFTPGMRIDNELSGDQAPDDALSTCFDAAPAAEAFEILGRPRVKLAFTVDQPVAQICARLCDVSPDGVSQRITYRPLNLNHFNGNDAPEMLEPGQVYHVEIALNECSHKLKAGHRLRLALSTSYWPIIWPSPRDTRITLHLADCALGIPVRETSVEADPLPPGPPRKIEGYKGERLREPRSEFTAREGDGGEIRIETFDDYGMARDPDHGIAVGSEVSQIYAITRGDPTSAWQEARWLFQFRRPGWEVDIETNSRMTATVTHFMMERRVIASQDGKVLLDRKWAEELPRGHH